MQMISLPSKLDVDDTLNVLLPVQLTTVESVIFKESCMQLLETNSSHKTIILDFRQNNFISSSGLGALVTLYKAAKTRGIELILRNVTPPAIIVLELTQLDQIFTIEPSKQFLGIAAERSENQLPKTHPSAQSFGKRLLDIVGGIIA